MAGRSIYNYLTSNLIDYIFECKEIDFSSNIIYFDIYFEYCLSTSNLEAIILGYITSFMQERSFSKFYHYKYVVAVSFGQGPSPSSHWLGAWDTYPGLATLLNK